MISSKLIKIFFNLVNNINIAKGIRNIQLIIITTRIVTQYIYRNSPKIIKYPKLIITGEIINIIELARNKICCKKNLFLILTKSIDIIKLKNVTRKPDNIHTINELIKDFIKYFFVKTFSVIIKLKKLIII